MLTLIRRTVIPVLGEQPSGASVSMKGCSEDEGQKDKCGDFTAASPRLTVGGCTWEFTPILRSSHCSSLTVTTRCS